MTFSPAPAPPAPPTQGFAYSLIDIRDAYTEGARAGAKHEPSEHLIERAVDAYCKKLYHDRTGFFTAAEHASDDPDSYFAAGAHAVVLREQADPVAWAIHAPNQRRAVNIVKTDPSPSSRAMYAERGWEIKPLFLAAPLPSSPTPEEQQIALDDRRAIELIASECSRAGFDTPDGTALGAVRKVIAALPSSPTAPPDTGGRVRWLTTSRNWFA